MSDSKIESNGDLHQRLKQLMPATNAPHYPKAADYKVQIETLIKMRDMRVHEELTTMNFKVIKVFGGFIYSKLSGEASVFVPTQYDLAESINIEIEKYFQILDELNIEYASKAENA